MAKLKLTYPEFRHAPSVICGTGSIRALADLDDGATAFFTSRQEAVIAQVSGALARGGGSLTFNNHLRKPAGEPTHDSVRYGAEFLLSSPFGRVVAVGGGSVLDWARLAWACSAGILDVETGALLPGAEDVRAPEFWLVPTTCATGAEAADVAVFCAASGNKAAAVSPAFLAHKVVLDGRFLESVSRAQLAAFLCDAISHSLEAALSLVPLQLGKESALSALNLIASSYDEPDGSSRRDRLIEASFLGGIAAANCSVGIVHAFAHSVGIDGLGHGVANACALVTGLEFNADAAQMRALLRRLGLGSHSELIEKVRPIVDHALEGIDRHPVAAGLRQSEYRHRVASRMSSDVAIRSNPRRASAEDLLAFVDKVAERVVSQ